MISFNGGHVYELDHSHPDEMDDILKFFSIQASFLLKHHNLELLRKYNVNKWDKIGMKAMYMAILLADKNGSMLKIFF